MIPRTIINEPFLEGTTPTLTGTLTNKAGVAIPLTDLLTLTLTLYSLDVTGFPIINARDAQNVKNANRVTVSAGGIMAWHLAKEDTAVQDTTRVSETHRALFKWTYMEDTYEQTGAHYIDFKVKNLER